VLERVREGAGAQGEVDDVGDGSRQGSRASLEKESR
jgi:hypothetical protein